MAKISPMLAAIMQPPKRSDKQLSKESARGSMRGATDDWVNGRISTKEHNAVHARGKHVLSGKSPREFKGVSGERKMKGFR